MCDLKDGAEYTIIRDGRLTAMDDPEQYAKDPASWIYRRSV